MTNFGGEIDLEGAFVGNSQYILRWELGDNYTLRLGGNRQVGVLNAFGRDDIGLMKLKTGV